MKKLLYIIPVSFISLMLMAQKTAKEPEIKPMSVLTAGKPYYGMLCSINGGCCARGFIIWNPRNSEFLMYRKNISSVIHVDAEKICEFKFEELTSEQKIEFETIKKTIEEKQNQQVDPTVKTPVESGKVQGTAGHP